jgi:hypothetical protein
MSVCNVHLQAATSVISLTYWKETRVPLQGSRWKFTFIDEISGKNGYLHNHSIVLLIVTTASCKSIMDKYARQYGGAPLLYPPEHLSRYSRSKVCTTGRKFADRTHTTHRPSAFFISFAASLFPLFEKNGYINTDYYTNGYLCTVSSVQVVVKVASFF